MPTARLCRLAAPLANLVPLSCLAAILLVTGIKLASPKLVKQMWNEGRYQFIPFVATVVAIVLTDLLIGILIGLAIERRLHSQQQPAPADSPLRGETPGRRRAARGAAQPGQLFESRRPGKALNSVPRGGHVLLDAQNTDYIDPDVLDLIRDFKEQTAPAHGVEVSFLGFRSQYQLDDRIQYVDYSTRELQNAITPQQVLLYPERTGMRGFASGQRLTRDLGRQLNVNGRGSTRWRSCSAVSTPARRPS